jgi:hypothetical protein
MASSAGGGQHRAAAQVFCRSQFNLANEACSLRTINTGTNPARPLNSNVSSYDEMQSSEHHDRELTAAGVLQAPHGHRQRLHLPGHVY